MQLGSIGFRHLELALLGLFVVALGLLFLRRRPAGLVWFSALLMVTMAVHLYLEAGRWQFAPLYLLTFVLAFWLARPAGRSYGTGPAYRLAGGVFRLLVVIVALPALALPFVAPLFVVPAPTGPHPVGTAEAHLAFTADAPPSARMRVWYPAREGSARTLAPFWSEDELGRHRLPGYPSLLSTHLSLVPTPAGVRATIEGERLPLLLVAPGSDALRGDYLHLILQAASSGWFVARLPPATDAPQLVASLELLLDPKTDAALSGRVDPERIALLRAGAWGGGDSTRDATSSHDDLGLPTISVGVGRTVEAALPSGRIAFGFPHARIPPSAFTLRALMVRPSRLLVGGSDVSPHVVRGFVANIVTRLLGDGTPASPVFSGRIPDHEALLGGAEGAVMEYLSGGR